MDLDMEIAQLVELGATVPQARAALKACKGDFAEAATAVVEGRFADAVDDGPVASSSSVRKRQSSSAMSVEDDDGGDGEDLIPDGDSDDFAPDADDLEDNEDEFMMPPDSDDEDQGTDLPQVVDQDAYGQIQMSKDRRETVIEIEEEPQRLRLSYPAGSSSRTIDAELLKSGVWLNGCPEGSEQGLLFQLYHHLIEGNVACPWDGCSGSIKRQASDFFAVPPSFSDYLGRLAETNDASCPRCSRHFCLACGEKNTALASTSSSRSKKPVAQVDFTSDRRLYHCADLQAVILGVGLCSVQRLYYAQNGGGSGGFGTAKRPKGEADFDPEAVAPKAKKQKAAKPDPTIDEDDEDDYPYPLPAAKGKASARGKGYAGDLKEDQTGRLAALKAQTEKDQDLKNLLALVRAYVPNRNRSWGVCDSDHLPGLQTLAHIRRRFNPLASDLLTRDSLAEMCSRAELYEEFFDWLEVIAAHENLCSIMAQPIMRIDSVTYQSPNQGSERQKAIVYAGSAGPRELLGTLCVQARAAQRGLQSSQDLQRKFVNKIASTNQLNGKAATPAKPVTEQETKESEEKRKIVDFADRVVRTVDSIDRSLAANKGDAYVKTLQALSVPSFDIETLQGSTVSMDDEGVRKVYLDWAAANRMGYEDLEVQGSNDSSDPSKLAYLHAHSKDIAATVTAGGSLRGAAIAKEHAVLATNVPVAWESSVFVRIDESRADVIKVLITGPVDTPYQNGCYLFDFFLPASYNRTPPLGKYMTTKGGTYRFNPNLYADGKICLSLLGTWSGPGWVAGTSTLLQVLISIQSMILTDEPYLNEPGWANGAGSPQSKAYNYNVRRQVVDAAMLGMILDPPYPFKDIIHTHFTLKSREIRKQLAKWEKEDDGNATAGDGGSAVGRSRMAGGTRNAKLSNDIKAVIKLLDRLDAGEKIETGAEISKKASTSAGVIPANEDADEDDE